MTHITKEQLSHVEDGIGETLISLLDIRDFLREVGNNVRNLRAQLETEKPAPEKEG